MGWDVYPYRNKIDREHLIDCWLHKSYASTFWREVYDYGTRYDSSGDWEMPNTPSDVYYDTNVNWFGAIILYLLAVLVVPFIYLGKLVKFIFTVGRKD